MNTENQDDFGADAGSGGCPAIAARRREIATDARVSDDEARDETTRNSDGAAHGENVDYRRIDGHGDIEVRIGNGLVAGDDIRQSANRHQAAERHRDGTHPQADNQHALHEADDETCPHATREPKIGIAGSSDDRDASGQT